MSKVLQVRQVGDPILGIKCEEVDVNNITSEILEEIEDLKETLNFSEGYGIAAPQVGINRRIVIIQVDKEKCYYKDCEDVPTTVMLNPVWRKLSEDTDITYEGWLSVPNIRGKVERYKNIEVTYYNEQGQKVVKQANGFTARDIQHECDHLDGIVFLERVKNHNGFATAENIKKYGLREE